jgi:hypothetical protein
VEFTPYFPSRESSALTAARKLSAVDKSTIKILAFYLGRQVARSRRPKPGQEDTGVANT